MQIYRKNP